MNAKNDIVSPADRFARTCAPRGVPMYDLYDITLWILAHRYGVDLATLIDPHFSTTRMVVLTKELPKLRVFPVDDHRSACPPHTDRTQDRWVPLDDDMIDCRILVSGRKKNVQPQQMPPTHLGTNTAVSRV